MALQFVANNPIGYERFVGRWSRKVSETFLDFANLNGYDRILDVGCGTGSLTNAVAGRYPDAKRITGIDLSAAYLEFAQERSLDPRVDYRLEDACELGSEDDSFDASVSLLVLNFIPSYQQAASEMLRVTRPRGRIAAGVWDGFGGLVVLRMFWDTAAMLDSKASEIRGRGMSSALAQEGKLAETFRAIGAVEVEETDLLVRMRFENFNDYWTPFLAGDAPPGAYLAGVDEGIRERLKAALTEAYCAGREDGPRSFVAVARAVRCRKP